MAKSVAIIGGGAAGFFTAINLAEKAPALDITIYEGSNKVLAKVLVSGGGRCNVTNRISEPVELINYYPRGNDFLLPVFQKFSSEDTRKWFSERGVPTKVEGDGRVFPKSNSSESIYHCLTSKARELEVRLEKNHRLVELSQEDEKWHLRFKDQEVSADYLVLCTGSNPKFYQLLTTKGIEIVPPLPSLFTFNAAQRNLIELAGISVPNASTFIKEIKQSNENGPLLITHWGYSAPAILKLSAWHARELAGLDYNFTLVINWNSYDKEELRHDLKKLTEINPKGKVRSWKDHNLPKRLWQYLFIKSELKEFTNWSEIGKKGINRLVAELTEFCVHINSKSTFKEEFVTAGGIHLDQVNADTMAMNTHQNLYAAGEVLNIDAITGGFNFQAAWSEGYIIASSIADEAIK